MGALSWEAREGGGRAMTLPLMLTGWNLFAAGLKFFSP